jgi:5-methylcytosine-specific restriction endonuclease McrA
MKLPSLRIDHDALYTKHKKAECKHQQVELRKKTTANAGVMIRQQCVFCGCSVGHSRKKSEFTAEEFANIPPWDDHLKNRHFEKRSAAYATLRDNADAEVRAKWLASYNAYLQTPEWKRKSVLVLKRDKHRCQGCLNAPATQAHHLTYEHVGEEFLFELVAVCDACHKRLHDDDDTDEQVPF